MGSKTTRTCLEEQMFGYLTKLGIPFSEQYPTRSGFVLDFLVELLTKGGSTIKIDLEVDGSAWHSKTAQRKRDKFRDQCMKHAGYEVIRFREGFTERFIEEQFHEIYRRYDCIIPGRPGT